jgi:hypothetical protein
MYSVTIKASLPEFDLFKWHYDILWVAGDSASNLG